MIIDAKFTENNQTLDADFGTVSVIGESGDVPDLSEVYEQLDTKEDKANKVDEITDDADAKKYPSVIAVKNFVSNSVSQSSEEIQEKIPELRNCNPINLFNKNDTDKISKKKWLNPNTGALTDLSGINTTGFISVENGKTYTFPVAVDVLWGTMLERVAIYNSDSDDGYIGYCKGNLTNGILTVTINDENAKYIRTSLCTNPNSKGYYWDTLMVVAGEEYPNIYVPFSERIYEAVFEFDLRQENVSALLNPLYRKTIIFAGDSICEGNTFGDTKKAWAGRIATRNQMVYKNYAVGGSTITEGVKFDKDGKDISISLKVDSMIKGYPNADYIIIEGGCNDADNLGDITNDEFGSFSAMNFSNSPEYDRGTFCGALESIFYRATQQWKGKKIGYIVAPKMILTTYSGTDYSAENNNRRMYFETAIQICKKWGIPVLNLWDDCYLNPSLSYMYDKTKTWEENQALGNMYADGQHLLSAGYDYIADIINNWLKTL